MKNLNPDRPKRGITEDSTHDAARYSSHVISLQHPESMTRCQRKSELCLAAIVMVVYSERK